MVTRIKAIYEDGVLKPTEPLEGIPEHQEVTLDMVTPYSNGLGNGDAPFAWSDLDDDKEEPAFWSDPKGDAELAKLTPEEQMGIFSKRKKTPDEIEADLRWLDENSGIFHLPPDQVLNVAMSDALLEGSQDW